MKTRKLLITSMLMLVLSSFLKAQTSKNVSFSSVSNRIDKEILKQKIDSLMLIEVGENQAGGAIGILSGDKVLLKSAYGLMNIEQHSAIDENTAFNISSVTKQFTAYAILMLQQEGKLNLDDNISNYLPKLPAYKEDISIRNLIQHTSGIASTDVLRLFAGLPFDGSWDQKSEIDLIMSYPQLNFTPNSKYVYSNGGYSLLAQIVENVSGMKYSEFLKKNVLFPLSMNATFVNDNPKTNLSNCATGYKKEKEIFIKFSSHEDTSYGAGNIYSSLNDMIAWGQNILSQKFGVDDYFNKITHPYNTLINGDSIFYTYGFNIGNHKGIKMVEHSGGNPGFRSQFIIFPDEELILILLFNTESINTRRLAFKITDLLLADKLKDEESKQRVEIKIDFEELNSFKGYYQMPDGMRLGFVLEQDLFWLVLPGNEKFQLYAESPTKFFLKAFNAQCTFIKNNDGLVNEMIWHQGGEDYKAGRAEEREPLSYEELALFTGNYYHNILNVEYPLVLLDGILTLKVPDTFKTYLGFEHAKLNHIGGDKFLSDRLGIIEFTRNSENQINGLVLLDVGRLQNILFMKH